MRVPISWLHDYLPGLPALEVLTAMLDDLGLVVEGVERIGEGMDDVVVVRVERIDAIKGADRIRLATVTDGTETIEVVCGAWNYEVGSLVPFAPVGTTLPNGMQIAQRKMRGVTSNGMLCSGAELGLGDDHEGLLVLDATRGARPGASILEVLGLEPDVVLDVTVEGNRPDAWCVEGIARDLAARMAATFAPVAPTPPGGAGAGAADLVSVEIADPDLCGRFVATVATGVTVGPSPEWLQRRLALAGMRPINNVVDASNYVMLELGQPTHPYDLDAVGGRGFVVRRALEGETLELLDGTVVELAIASGVLGDTGEDLLICDASGRALGLAGVMGGASSEITESTTTVALEAAWFEPMAIARTSKRLRLRTEASVRFERGCDPALPRRASARFFELLAMSSPGLILAAGAVEVTGVLPIPPTIEISSADLTRTLGVEIDLAEVAALLEAVGFGIASAGGSLAVTAPSGRPDVRPAPFGVADVAEEVARLHGYASIPATVPSWPQPGGLCATVRSRRSVREALVGAGALEAWTATIVAPRDAALLGNDEEPVRVTNPVSSDEPLLRASLMPGLLAALRHNVERRQGDVALFEVGTVFVHPSAAEVPRVERGGVGGGDLVKLPSEDERVSAVFARPGDDSTTAVAAWRAIASALRLDGVRLESLGAHAVPRGVHPTRCALLVDAASSSVLGVLGEVDPEVVARAVPGLGEERRIGWLDCSAAALADPDRATRRTRDAVMPSKFPSSDVDLALVVDQGVDVWEVKRVLAAAAGELCESVRCFDAYRGPGVPEGSRSLALRVRLCAQDRTLSDAELAAARSAMIEAASSSMAATLR